MAIFRRSGRSVWAAERALSRLEGKRSVATRRKRPMRIGELSRLTGVSTRTIRYYEELGVLPPPERSDGGSRRYPPEYKFYVEGTRLMKDLGLTLEEIRLVGWWCLGRRLPPG